MNRVECRRLFWFPVPPAELWHLAGQFDSFESWWEWLRHFEATPGGLADGTVLRGTIVPPVPWRLRLEVRLRRCRPPQLIEAEVTGDVHGSAVLRLDGLSDGTRVELASSLEVHSTRLRAVARLAHPLMRWGHDRAIDRAVAGFWQHALPATVTQPRA